MGLLRSFLGLTGLCVPLVGMAQPDTAAAPARINPAQQQLRLSFDISRPVINAFSDTRNSYELALDYSLGKEVYATAEGGFGGSKTNHGNLSYTTDNSFIKVGIDKTMLPRFMSSDWDMVFTGLRYGMAFVKRNEATYTTQDNFWGTTTGKIASTDFVAHWAELTAGIKVELVQSLFVGWTVRGKFLLNQGPFRQLAPSFVAGYGRGEKTTIFDFNLYACYALRWNKRPDKD